jgi:ribosomal protein S21
LRPYLKKLFTKIGLVEWLKVKALSSSPSTKKKKKNTETEPRDEGVAQVG